LKPFSVIHHTFPFAQERPVFEVACGPLLRASRTALPFLADLLRQALAGVASVLFVRTLPHVTPQRLAARPSPFQPMVRPFYREIVLLVANVPSQ
jgi:hypothetical protein